LFYKEDWEESKPRFEAWWNRDVADRPLVQVTAPRREPLPSRPVRPPPSARERWLDADYRIGRFQERASRTSFLGDAFPFLDTNIGPGSLALYLGSPPTFDDATVWYGKCVENLAQSPLPHYDPSNPLWQASLDLCRHGVQRLRGRALVTFPDLIENLDTLASLRGTQELLFDLTERPDEVHRWQRAILDRYFDYYDRLYEIVQDADGGSCFSGFHIWGPGRIAKLQCDMSAMISPAMFEEFVVPYLAEQCRRLDYSVYHLDGPQAIQHLDSLLAIRELDAIQWTPGEGQPGLGSEVWMPLYRRIRSGGKSLMLIFLGAREAERIVEELGPEGIDLCLLAETEEEGREIVRRSPSWQKRP
jgi:hypothetical protein